MFEPTNSFCSTQVQLDPTQGALFGALAKLRRCARAPVDCAGVVQVCRGAVKATRAANAWLHRHGARQAAVSSTIEDLEALLRWADGHIPEGTTEVAPWVGRRLTSHAPWAGFGEINSWGVAPVVEIAAGLLLLRAWHADEPLSAAVFMSLRASPKTPNTMSTDEMHRCLQNRLSGDEPAWLVALHKAWPGLKLLMCIPSTPDGCGIPTIDTVAEGRWTGTRDYPALGVRDMTFTHRQLSHRQFGWANAQIAAWLRDGAPLGVFAALSSISGLTIEQVGQIPLSRPGASRLIELDVEAGALSTDIVCVARQAGHPPAYAKCLRSDTRFSTPLPKLAADVVRRKASSVPGATTLAELFPGFHAPTTESSIEAHHDAITPSWARWHNTLGIALRRAGIDAHVTALVTKDFGHSVKSKWYYARVLTTEIAAAAGQLYSMAGWGEPQEIDTSMQYGALGSSLMPAADTIQRIVAHLKNQTGANPAGLPLWACNLNKEARSLAFYMSVLLGLREALEYAISSDFDEISDPFLLLNDKVTAALPFGGAVPVGLWLRQRITDFRRKCSRAQERAHGEWGPKSQAATALKAVASRTDGRLLFRLSSGGNVAPLGTAGWRASLPFELWVAPDLGRKLLENELRRHGLPPHAIDAMLRHERCPSSRSDSSSDFHLMNWIRRLERIQDQIATEWLCCCSDDSDIDMTESAVAPVMSRGEE